jgi:hypothetical protein
MNEFKETGQRLQAAWEHAQKTLPHLFDGMEVFFQDGTMSAPEKARSHSDTFPRTPISEAQANPHARL